MSITTTGITIDEATAILREHKIAVKDALYDLHDDPDEKDREAEIIKVATAIREVKAHYELIGTGDVGWEERKVREGLIAYDDGKHEHWESFCLRSQIAPHDDGAFVGCVRHAGRGEWVRPGDVVASTAGGTTYYYRPRAEVEAEREVRALFGGRYWGDSNDLDYLPVLANTAIVWGSNTEAVPATTPEDAKTSPTW